jgi:hypothetical protein
MASKGAAQDSDHIWEAKECSTRTYMRFSEGGSRKKWSNSQLVTKNKKMDLVEGSTSFKEEKRNYR